MDTVGQVMVRDVFTIHPDTTVRAAISALIENDVSGMPVTDDEGNVLGVVSELALFDVLFDAEIQQMPVSRFMTRHVHTITESDLLVEAAHQFALHGVRRFPVVADGKLVGILSRRDLLRFCDSQGDQLPLKGTTPVALVDDFPELLGGLPENDYYDCGL